MRHAGDLPQPRQRTPGHGAGHRPRTVRRGPHLGHVAQHCATTSTTATPAPSSGATGSAPAADPNPLAAAKPRRQPWKPAGPCRRHAVLARNGRAPESRHPLVIARPLPSAQLVVAFAVALLAAACGGTGAAPSPASSPSASPPAAPSESPAAASESPAPSASPSAPATAGPSAAALLLEVTNEGGFINPAASHRGTPPGGRRDDGRILLPRPSPDASRPLVVPVEVRDMGPAGAAAILAAMRPRASTRRARGGVAADTGSTVFTAVIDGETIVSRFAAGPGGAGGPGRAQAGPGVPGGSGSPDASGAPATPGAAAFALLARLTDPGETWGCRDRTRGGAVRPGRLPRVRGAGRRDRRRRGPVAPRGRARGVRHAHPPRSRRHGPAVRCRDGGGCPAARGGSRRPARGEPRRLR